MSIEKEEQRQKIGTDFPKEADLNQQEVWDRSEVIKAGGRGVIQII